MRLGLANLERDGDLERLVEIGLGLGLGLGFGFGLGLGLGLGLGFGLGLGLAHPGGLAQPFPLGVVSSHRLAAAPR